MFCFFKQKTAYERRISDWSSDVCSSDLSGWTILALAVSVFTLVTIWEMVAERVIAKRRVLVVGGSTSAAEIADAIEFEGHTPFSTEERRVGKESVRKCSSRWLPYH